MISRVNTFRLWPIAIVLTIACGNNPAPEAPVEAGNAQDSAAPAMDHAAAGHGGKEAGGGDRLAAELAFLFPDGNDRGWADIRRISGAFHVLPELATQDFGPAARAELARQLNLTSYLVHQYSTVKEAEAAGYRRAGPYAPGFGAHWQGGTINTSGSLTDEEIRHPYSLLFGGISLDAPLVGFMYTSTARNPEGFAGPTDHWHSHRGTCIKAGSGASEALGSDGLVPRQQCEALGFTFDGNLTYPMLHVWTVPGYTSRLGVFSHENPAITCKDGGYRINKDWGNMDYLLDRCEVR